MSRTLSEWIPMDLPFERAGNEGVRKVEELIVLHLYELPSYQMILSSELALVSYIDGLEAVDEVLASTKSRQMAVGLVVRRLIEEGVIKVRPTNGRNIFKLAPQLVTFLKKVSADA